MDQALCLWDVNERTCLEKRLLPGSATGLAWHPGKNELAVITEDGQCLMGGHCIGWESSGLRALCVGRALCGERNGKSMAAAGLGRGPCLQTSCPVNMRIIYCKRQCPASHQMPFCLTHTLPAGQLAVWQEPVPAKLPGPTADVDALAGIKQVWRGWL